MAEPDGRSGAAGGEGRPAASGAAGGGAAGNGAAGSGAAESDRQREVRLLEELAANAWAPYTSQALGAWRLRATFGVTMRANSVWTVGDVPEGDWLAAAETFYRRRGLPSCFFVSDGTPDGVDDALAAAGYEKRFPCFLMTGAADETLRRASENGRFEVVLEEEADDAWIADFIRLEGFEPARAAAYRHIFGAIGPPKAFARLTTPDGATAALATVVAERGYAGVSNVIVAPDRRRQGAAERLMGALAAWAKAQGAVTLWLQVVEDNAPALALYRKLGFEPRSRFHYRQRAVLPDGLRC
ncbi:GNAT family N-acetyltransferase [Paenibacillus sp.]|uniref:GNAT family N-acetyltransferase n=1 Tax=Paenibacillus sp. TaxID=58172 RepID=UPI002D33AA85|nr:GNAT family N-acetyltransferase [Paenibacillus sp.]HZG56747.1 GNAT family N-acetyltransferase [Paenibacillus sp.]